METVLYDDLATWVESKTTPGVYDVTVDIAGKDKSLFVGDATYGNGSSFGKIFTSGFGHTTGVFFNITLTLNDDIEDISYMFGKPGLNNILNVNILSGKNLKVAKGMFYSCEYDRPINITINNAPNLTDISEMFKYCTLKGLTCDFTGCPNITNVSSMFYQSKAADIDLSFLKGSNIIEDTSHMFYYLEPFDESVTNIIIDVSHLVNVKNTSNMFYDSKVTVKGFDKMTSIVDGSSMFDRCSNPPDIVDFSKLQSLVNADSMFSSPGKPITFKNIGSLVNVKKAGYMFHNNTFTEIDITGLGGNNIVDGGFIFSNCKNLKKVNMGNVKLSNAFYIFDRCTSLTTVENFNLRYCKDLGFAFRETAVESINLSGLNSSAYINEVAKGCTKLREITISTKTGIPALTFMGWFGLNKTNEENIAAGNPYFDTINILEEDQSAENFRSEMISTFTDFNFNNIKHWNKKQAFQEDALKVDGDVNINGLVYSLGQELAIKDETLLLNTQDSVVSGIPYNVGHYFAKEMSGIDPLFRGEGEIFVFGNENTQSIFAISNSKEKAEANEESVIVAYKVRYKAFGKESWDKDELRWVETSWQIFENRKNLENLKNSLLPIGGVFTVFGETEEEARTKLPKECVWELWQE